MLSAVRNLLFTTAFQSFYKNGRVLKFSRENGEEGLLRTPGVALKGMLNPTMTLHAPELIFVVSSVKSADTKCIARRETELRIDL
jgi:hypothetical protein